MTDTDPNTLADEVDTLADGMDRLPRWQWMVPKLRAAARLLRTITPQPETDARSTLAYLMWCFSEGYLTPEDRAVGGGNWMLRADDQLHPDDITTRDDLLSMADEVIAALLRTTTPPATDNTANRARALLDHLLEYRGTSAADDHVADILADLLTERDTLVAGIERLIPWAESYQMHHVVIALREVLAAAVTTPTTNPHTNGDET